MLPKCCACPGQQTGISHKQVNRHIRTAFLETGRREGATRTHPERSAPRTHWGSATSQQCTAAPLAELFAFLAQGHPQCTFIKQEHLALNANPQFWQCGLLAFCSECCASNIDHTFMQTVIMSFVRGMTYGQQELPIDDLFIHFPCAGTQSSQS